MTLEATQQPYNRSLLRGAVQGEARLGRELLPESESLYTRVCEAH